MRNTVKTLSATVFGCKISSVNSEEFVAKVATHDISKKAGVSTLEALCLFKGWNFKSSTTASEVVESIRAAVKVAHPTKLRKVAKTHKRNRKVVKVARATTRLFTQVVNTGSSSAVTAERILTQATQKVAFKLGVSLKEVMAMQPQDILDTEGRVIPLFRGMVKAMQIAKALV